MSHVLASLGWDAGFDDLYAPYRQTDCRPGRVARVDRGVCTVLTVDGVVRAGLAGSMLTAAAADPVALPCAGDWVAVRSWPDRRLTVEAVLPRRTAVVRTGAGRDSHGQVLAANLDTAAVVEPLDPEPDLGRLERLLALAWDSGAAPLVVLTKADMVPDPYAVAEQVATGAPGVPVHTVSGKRGTGLAPLRPLVAAGRTMGLLGASGAGKSTLVNALAGTTVMVIRRLRADGRGRHTTTYRALVPIPDGGTVLDTPGLRSVGLLDGAAGLDLAFADIDLLAEACRFSDCEHDREPDCAVQAAIDAGELPERRLDSWRKLQRELAWQARRRQARLTVDARNRQRKRSPRRIPRLPETGG
ncbi:MAG: ribosome small subunit-dependent GTPase A [Micromonosporaceae bacterium]